MYRLDDEDFAAALHSDSSLSFSSPYLKLSASIPPIHINNALDGQELLIPIAVMMMTLFRAIPSFLSFFLHPFLIIRRYPSWIMIAMATESVCIPFDITLSHREHSLSPGSKIRLPLGLWHPLNGLHSSAMTTIQVQCQPILQLWNYGILTCWDWLHRPSSLQLYCALNIVGCHWIVYPIPKSNVCQPGSLGAPKGLKGKSEESWDDH